MTCVIIGLTTKRPRERKIFAGENVQMVDVIGPYLVQGSENIVIKRSTPLHTLSRMDYGNKPTDGGNLVLSAGEQRSLAEKYPQARDFIREYIGSQEFIRGASRYCLWIDDNRLPEAESIPEILLRINNVKSLRAESKGQQANQNAATPHRFVFAPHTDDISIVIPRHFSERRKYLTAGLLNGNRQVIADSASAIYNANLVDFSILSSNLHMVWVDTVAGRIKSDYRYSSTLVWNTFPVPLLTEQNRVELTQCAENILLAREAHFPATIADLYDPDNMPEDLRRAHERNDEVLERIYIGRRFRNDTERLEKLFDLYTKMTAAEAKPAKKTIRARKTAQ